MATFIFFVIFLILYLHGKAHQSIKV